MVQSHLMVLSVRYKLIEERLKFRLFLEVESGKSSRGIERVGQVGDFSPVVLSDGYFLLLSNHQSTSYELD